MPKKKIKKKKASYFSKITRWVFLLLVLAILSNYVWRAMLKLQYLNLNEAAVTISGNEMVSANTVLNTLGLRYGQNILTIEMEILEEKLAALDRIKSAEVSRDFPDGLKVKIQEVKTAGYIIKDKTRYVVTEEGDIFPGLEGPPIEFKNTSRSEMIDLASFLERIRLLDQAYYDSIEAIAFDYSGQVILYKVLYYVKWLKPADLDSSDINNNIYLERKLIKNYNKESREVNYIDFRFVEYLDGSIKGALIVK